MNQSSFLKINHILIGLLLGITIPLIIMQFWWKRFSNLSLIELIHNPFFSEIVNILKGSLLVNLGIFFIFYWLKKDHSAKGVVLATLIYGVFYIYYAFFM